MAPATATVNVLELQSVDQFVKDVIRITGSCTDPDTRAAPRVSLSNLYEEVNDDQ